MVERGKNNPSIVMWSIGNEVGEADGSDKSVATVRRSGQDHQEVDATRYVTMGADKFRLWRWIRRARKGSGRARCS